tara:strand:- start:2474 stop:2617 length:144 start_codon:yes stop_codon:yes gene_type:complete
MMDINIKTRCVHILDLNMIKLKNKEYNTRKNTPSPVESEKDFSIFVL